MLVAEPGNSNMATLFASIEKISHRLDKLEQLSPSSKTLDTDPSIEKFNVAEAFADTKEKTCTFEPNGRPCDHCAMCSALGF